MAATFPLSAEEALSNALIQPTTATLPAPDGGVLGAEQRWRDDFTVAGGLLGLSTLLTEYDSLVVYSDLLPERSAMALLVATATARP